ncbi:hypothetical protein ALC57_16347 [Trachymyrmex cornetzi]|uniref:Uncharacterized protein n=1 Tax=Trachymyrmex cornetzi TaxID=471704 RepID=A0A195DF90_9HYME|nr:hypothetical protein ALC57_16347 [Trachymyrmex cornetzi]
MTLPPLFSCHFPSYMKNCFNNEVDILWYQPEFTQSRYPPGQKLSEACTLICLLVAVRISRGNVSIYDIENCPRLNIIVAEAIIEGNTIHAWLIKKRLISHPYLNTEDALKHGGKSLNILKEWVTLFDSHSHTTDNSNHGLVIAQTTIDRLESLCNWYIQDVLKNCYNIHANKYELAFLYSYTQCKGHNRILCECKKSCKM